MAKLKIEDIRAEVEGHNWKLISEEYTNLDTEMEFICAEGHRVFKPYKNIRNKFECPICKKNPYHKVESIKVPEKGENTFRVIALDQATKVSGYSIFDDGKLIKYGVIHPREDYEQILRISIMRQWLLSAIEDLQPDIIILEDIQLQNFTGQKGAYTKGDANSIGIITYKTLAELLGVLKVSAFEQNILCEVIPPATWRSKVGISGRTRADKKKSAQLKVKDWYQVDATQDEAEAICLGKYGTEFFAKEIPMIEWG